MSAEFILEGYVLEIDERLEKYNEIMVQFRELAIEGMADTEKNIEACDDFEDFINSIANIAAEPLDRCINHALKILMDHDIWSFSADNFKELYYDWFPVETLCSDYIELYNKLTEAKDNLDVQRALERFGRSEWVGAGFGLGGAIRGAIDAGIMNIITNVARSFSDSIQDSADKKMVKTVGDEIFRDAGLKEKFLYGIQTYCENIGAALLDFLNQAGIINAPYMNAEKAGAIFDNVCSHRLELDKDIKIKKILECIGLFPYNERYYSELLSICGPHNLTVPEIADYFGYGYEQMINYLSLFDGDLDKALEMPERKPAEIQKKADAIKAYLVKINFVEEDGKINDEFINLYSANDFFEDVEKEYNRCLADACVVQGKKFGNSKDAQNYYNYLLEEQKKEREMKKLKEAEMREEQRKIQERERRKEGISEGIGATLGCLFWIALGIGFIVGIFYISSKALNIDWFKVAEDILNS